MKEIIKKLIVGFMATALATYYFTGCTQATEPIDSIPDLGYATTEEANPGIDETDGDSGVDSFSIKYKYWYDNPDVAEAQTNAKLDYDLGNWTETEDYFLDLAGLPIYVNTDTNDKFIFSGRTPVFLHNNTMSADDARLLRDSNGYKLYFTPNINPTTYAKLLKSFTDRLADSGSRQPETYEDRINSSDTTIDTTKQYDLYVNNFQVLASDEPIQVNNYVDLGLIFDFLNIGSLTPLDGAFKISYATAAQEVVITITEADADNYTLSYNTDDKDTTISKGELILTGSTASMSLQAIEDYLGFDVEVYEDFINIVTDNKDIVTAENVLDFDKTLAENIEPSSPSASADANDPDTTSNPSNTENPADETPTNTSTSSDGKYTLETYDIDKGNGTYSYTLTEGMTVSGYDYVFTADDVEWFKQIGRGEANQSKIPYSQLTIENAAEAFPYLGYCGYVPDYYEVEPDMTDEQIVGVIVRNISGQYRQSLNNTVSRDATPRFFFKSKEEHDAYLAEKEAQAEAIDESDRRAREHWEKVQAGEAHIGDVDTDLSFEEWWNS